jgi:hypothetical protein
MIEENEKEKILQIIPSGGWKAVFAGDEKPLFLDLVCWALVVQDGETYVRGMVGHKEVESIHNDPGFLGYKPPSSEENSEPDWNEESAEHMKGQSEN